MNQATPAVKGDNAMKPETAQHTPTPWIVRPQELDENMRQIRHESSDGLASVIATIHNETVCEEHGGDAIANAAFIVRAVNAYKEMFDLLHEIHILHAVLNISESLDSRIDLALRK